MGTNSRVEQVEDKIFKKTLTQEQLGLTRRTFEATVLYGNAVIEEHKKYRIGLGSKIGYHYLYDRLANAVLYKSTNRADVVDKLSSIISERMVSSHGERLRAKEDNKFKSTYRLRGKKGTFINTKSESEKEILTTPTE